ncbi:DUF6461 domain-containing protein [Solwaraspora sp. WMMA2056]|uniref:DUF6461 domain-containing protein n=1 Tax=Solwaraspora sp. WMMA2056 TaxID=3015161 RepID=UPI00259B47F2|nr:DUF6461 domain-containing protein [Solwaraspora sp. WMMA2056]WJK39485.1 DUF6461 domain-containing protein [Solwaraspora sp. WMMA2056]
MNELSDVLVAECARAVRDAVPLIAGRIPAGPAARLGRLAVPDDEITAGRDAWGSTGPAAAAHPTVPGGSVDPAALVALRGLGHLSTERLLGALELTVADLTLSGVPDLSQLLPPPPTKGQFLFATTGHDGEALSAVTLLERLRPGIVDLVETLTRRLAAHPHVAPLLAVSPGADNGSDVDVDGSGADSAGSGTAREAAMVARHGAGHLALAVATAVAVVDQARIPPIVDRAVATVGLGLGVAVEILRRAPMPPGYADALLARIRDEFAPMRSFERVEVTGQRFALREGQRPVLPVVTDDAFAGNGLVAVVDGGAVVRTGATNGVVSVEFAVLAQPPEEVSLSGWEEVVEVSWRAAQGRASLVGATDVGGGPWRQRRRNRTAPWPGDYRLRVHAQGRDDGDNEFERYELMVWPAPPTPDVVHLRTDRLGHRLRGEPEPVRQPRPEHAYRWVRRGPLSVAGTVTVATGVTVDDVLRAFGADPARPTAIDEIEQQMYGGGRLDPWVTVRDTGGAVIVVEVNGYEGTHGSVLRTASARGRAASMFWNVNAVTRLSFAERGELIESFEPWGDTEVAPVVVEAIAGLDFDVPRDRVEKGLVAVERFTGYGVTEADVARIWDAGVGFRVTDQDRSLT